MNLGKTYLYLKKIHTCTFFLIFIMLLALERCRITVFPFLNGKYIYWLFALVVGGIYFLLKNGNKSHNINYFDICIIVLFGLGLYNFIYLSKATVFNVNVWSFIGYLFLYIILRQLLSTKGVIYNALNCSNYCLVFLAVLNGIIAVLQVNNIVSYENEYFRNTGLFYSPNQLGLFIALGFLSSITLIKKDKKLSFKILLIACQIILIYALYLSQCRGAFLALVITLIFNILKLIYRNKIYAVWKIVFVFCFLLASTFLIVKNNNAIKEQSSIGRLFVLKITSKQIEKKMLLGNGFDSFSLQYNLAKADYFSIQRPWEETRNASYLYNANNDFLELGFELGIIWLIIFFIFIIMLFIKAKNSYATKASCSLLLCIIIFSFTNTILPVPLFVILGCIFTVVIINESEKKSIFIFKQNHFFAGIAIVFLFAFSSILVLRLNAEYKLGKIYNQKEISGLKKTENYASKIDANGEQLFMAGIIFMKNNNQEEGLRYLTNGFKKSGKPTLGRNLARLFERMGNYEKAEEIYIYNKNVEPFRFEARMDLFNLYIKTNQKEKARKMAKEIFYLPIKIPSKEIESFKEKAKNYLKN